MPETTVPPPLVAPTDTASPAGAPPCPEPTISGSLEDAFLLAGLFEGEETADLLASLKESHNQKAAEKTDLDQARIAALEEEVAKLEEIRQREAEEAGQLKEEKRANDAQAAEVLPKYRRLLERQSARMKNLLARRSSYPLRRTRNKLDDYREMSKALAEQLLAEEQQRLERDRLLHQGWLERRQWTQKEHERKERFLEGQLAQAEERLRQADAWISKLRTLGITRRSAGFLVWAGYLSFAGFGWFVGESIRSVAEKDSGFMQALLTLLAGGLKALMGRLGMGLGIGAVVVGPLLLLALAFGVFFLADFLLGKFDRGWKGRGGSGRRSSSLSPWGPFQNPFRDVGRNDYVQILARMPVLYLWVVVSALAAVFFGLGGNAAPRADLAVLDDPVQTLTYTFLGLVLCVAIAAAILLYVVFVVGPRHRRYLGEEPIGGRAAIWMNIELAAFLASMIVLVIAPDLLRAAIPGIPSIWQKGATAGIWLLPALGGFAVSYGLIYKGVFRDHNGIKREVQSLFENLDTASSFSSNDGEEDSAARWSSAFAHLRQEIEDKWENVDLWTRPAVRFRLLRFRWSTLKELMNPPAERTSQGGFDITVADVLFEPQLAEEVNQVLEEVAELRQVLEGLNSRNQEIAVRLEQIGTDAAKERVAALRRQIAEEGARNWRERAEMTHAHQELVARCRNAYRIGEFLRQDLRPQELAVVRQTA